MAGDYLALDVDSEREQWSERIRQADTGDVYFSPGFHETFCVDRGVTPKLFVYEDNGRSTLFPLLLRSIPGSDRRDVTTVYGYGGLLVPQPVRGDPDYSRGLLAALADWYRQERVVAEFVRYHPVLATHVYSPIRTDFVRHTVAVDTTLDLDTIWADYESRTRGQIRQSQRAGLSFEVSAVPDRLGTFADLYGATMEHLDAAAFYRFPERLLREHFERMPGHTYLATVEHEGEPLAAALFLGWGPRLHYHLSGSNRGALKLRPNNALLHGAIEWAHGEGFRSLHLGGGHAGDDSLFAFKRGFSPGGCREFHVSRRIIDPDAYQELVLAWRRRRPGDAAYDPDFFPLYRAPVLEP